MRKSKLVAEFTTNHLGNLNLLLRMVQYASSSGADLIKMQAKDVESFYSQEKLNSLYKSPYGKTYRDYRSLFEFDADSMVRFDQAVRTAGIEWFTTIQDFHSIGKALAWNKPYVKIASINARDQDFLRKISESTPLETEIVISLAGSSLDEIDQALSQFPKHKITILHCVAEYPCAPDRLRLGNIPELIARFRDDRISIGYSGHETGIGASLAAADLGAEMIERHFCLSRNSFAHHIDCSLEPEEFAQLKSILHQEGENSQHYRDLPEEAFQVNFGMSEAESNFLLGSRTGTDYLRRKSELFQGS